MLSILNGLSGLCAIKNVVEASDLEREGVRNVLRTEMKLRSATQSSVANGVPGISGQSAPGSVVVEQETGREIVQRERNVMEQDMSRNIVTIRSVKVFQYRMKLRL